MIKRVKLLLFLFSSYVIYIFVSENLHVKC